MTDIIKNKDGVSSKSISRKELEDIASKSQKQEFNAKNHGLTANSTINMEHLLKQALKTGYTTAVITATFQLAPEIYKAVDFLIKHGEIDIQQIKRIGISGISANAEGFLHGSISSSVLIMCEQGMLGEAFKDINPTVLGALVAVVMQTVKNSILVSAKKMSAQQMGAAFVDTIVISGGYLIGSHIGGIIGQTLGFELPVIGYLLGSLIGTSLCVVYNIGKKKLISFCIDTGFTCFGLVEQNYELPDEILNELGIETAPILRTEIKRTNLPKTEKTVTAIDRTEYETINITVLRRGIIGVNRVGYIK